MYDSIVGGRSIHFKTIFSVFQNIVGIISKELLFSVNGSKLFDEIPTNREMNVFFQ